MTHLFYPAENLKTLARRALEREAKLICQDCPYIMECREIGITQEIYGVWGGLTSEDMALERRARGIKLARDGYWTGKHRYCGTESGYQYCLENNVFCEDCLKAHENYEADCLHLDPYQREGNHGSCGTEGGYQNLRRRAMHNGVPAGVRKVHCLACRKAHSLAQRNRRDDRERK
jgi:hypothetical protein